MQLSCACGLLPSHVLFWSIPSRYISSPSVLSVAEKEICAYVPAKAAWETNWETPEDGVSNWGKTWRTASSSKAFELSMRREGSLGHSTERVPMFRIDVVKLILHWLEPLNWEASRSFAFGIARGPSSLCIACSQLASVSPAQSSIICSPSNGNAQTTPSTGCCGCSISTVAGVRILLLSFLSIGELWPWEHCQYKLGRSSKGRRSASLPIRGGFSGTKHKHFLSLLFLFFLSFLSSFLLALLCFPWLDATRTNPDSN